MRKSRGRDFMDSTFGLIGAWALTLSVMAFVGARDGLRRISAALKPKGVWHG